jgi:CheY-like chemotaxis protein
MTRPLGEKQLDVATGRRILCPRMESPENMARRILVVDDEPMVCDAILRILELDKHSVKTAASAQEALTVFEAGKFDLIIIDYEMPLMKGDKLAAAIKAQAPKQPIIMVTAYGESLRAAGDFPLAVDLVINKPFGVKEFREAVSKVAARG